ncbi:MAG TPA: type II toxin-antitoxin system HigB family toxin, partial [Pirellulales bacterium]|nr:type II toxin-antitoxin system HigB family toxin [Pirellulales bacterium]
MHVISAKKLREFWDVHADAEMPLRAWLKRVENATWNRFADVRLDYPHADQYERCVIFNVGGNKYRLTTSIHYNRQKVYVRQVLTHA